MSRLRSNKVVNQAGTGAPELTYGAVVPATGTISGAGGINVTGVVTATSFSGDGSGLTGVGDPSALKDGSNTKVQAVSTGANVTGNVAATGNLTAVDGTFSGNLTVQGTTTTIDTAVTSVDSLSLDGDINLVDGSKINVGTGTDLQIEHTGGNSFIRTSATANGDLAIEARNTGDLYLSAADDVFIRPQGSENGIKVVGNGAVELYYDNAKKFETTASGVIVTGMTTVTGISSFQGNVHITGSLEVAQDLTFNTNVNIIGIATLGTLDTTNFGTIGAGIFPSNLLLARDCDITGDDILGPYWSEGHPSRSILANSDEPGSRIFISGRVTANDCETPIQNALVDQGFCIFKPNQQFYYRARDDVLAEVHQYDLRICGHGQDLHEVK